jgi:hypothetical protein
MYSYLKPTKEQLCKDLKRYDRHLRSLSTFWSFLGTELIPTGFKVTMAKVLKMIPEKENDYESIDDLTVLNAIINFNPETYIQPFKKVVIEEMFKESNFFPYSLIHDHAIGWKNIFLKLLDYYPDQEDPVKPVEPEKPEEKKEPDEPEEPEELEEPEIIPIIPTVTVVEELPPVEISILEIPEEVKVETPKQEIIEALRKFTRNDIHEMKIYAQNNPNSNLMKALECICIFFDCYNVKRVNGKFSIEYQPVNLFKSKEVFEQKLKSVNMESITKDKITKTKELLRLLPKFEDFDKVSQIVHFLIKYMKYSLNLAEENSRVNTPRDISNYQ